MKNIDWSNLPFGYMRTDYNVRCYYRNGEWGAFGALLGRDHQPAHGRNLPTLRTGRI